MKKTLFILALLSFLILNHSFAQNVNLQYQISDKIHLDGDGSWDYLNMDELTNRLYISHGTEVQILDVFTKNTIGIIPDTKGVHGIALAKALNKGFISNGKDTSVTVFNLKTLEFITKIKVTGNNPDAILFDPFSGKVFVFNGRSANATVIDSKTEKVIATIALSGKPEFSVTDLKGKIYVNIEDKSEVCEINALTNKVEKTWSVNPGKEPSGLAIDIKNHRLFSVCGNKLMVVSNTETGKVVTTAEIGENVDGVAFDPDLKRIYSSNGEGTLTIIQQEDANTYKILDNFTTQKGARTIALNTITHTIYLPTAEYGETPAATKEHPKPRPTIKPNTFNIIEISTK